MALTLDESIKLCEAAIAKANELGIKISVAVCDPGGRLKAFARMDGAIWASVYGSQGKATTSVGFGRPSVMLQERADHPTIKGIIAASGSNMIPGQGAIPVIRNGVVEGACGVGGGTGEEDEICAQAAVDSL